MDTPTPNRLRYTFAIGGDHDDLALNPFIQRASELISEMTGGLTVLQGTGIWRKDGNSQPPHTGEMADEKATVLTFVVPPEQDAGLGQYKDAIRMAQSDTQPDISWVNTEVEPVYCDHFRADMPAAGERHTSGDGHAEGEPVIE